MKIKEALNFINATTTVRAKVDDNNNLIIGSSNRPYQDWFLLFPANATSWNRILEVWNSLDHVTAQDLARVMDIIQRLLDTPVDERFPEKKYRLVVKRETSFHPKYVSNIITGFDELVFDLSKDEKEARIFGEKELNQIKEREPSLALAIDTMKEEVMTDEN